MTVRNRAEKRWSLHVFWALCRALSEKVDPTTLDVCGHLPPEDRESKTVSAVHSMLERLAAEDRVVKYRGGKPRDDRWRKR